MQTTAPAPLGGRPGTSNRVSRWERADSGQEGRQRLWAEWGVSAMPAAGGAGRMDMWTQDLRVPGDCSRPPHPHTS